MADSKQSQLSELLVRMEEVLEDTSQNDPPGLRKLLEGVAGMVGHVRARGPDKFTARNAEPIQCTRLQDENEDKASLGSPTVRLWILIHHTVGPISHQVQDRTAESGGAGAGGEDFEAGGEGAGAGGGDADAGGEVAEAGGEDAGTGGSTCTTQGQRSNHTTETEMESVPRPRNLPPKRLLV